MTKRVRCYGQALLFALSMTMMSFEISKAQVAPPAQTTDNSSSSTTDSTATSGSATTDSTMNGASSPSGSVDQAAGTGVVGSGSGDFSQLNFQADLFTG